MLFKQATTDSLTGIANRHSFFEKGEKLLATARSQNRYLSMVLLDFDHLKAISDNYGHDGGDLCLRLSCLLIQQNLRPRDFFARIGGEEFAIIIPDTTLLEAYNVAEKIRLMINEQRIQVTGKVTFNCSVSMGICAKSLPHNEVKTLLINADIALYKAKESGRNRIHLFH